MTINHEKGVVEMTRAEWAAKHPDFKGRRADGTRCVNALNPQTGGTESWPVEIITEAKS